MSTCKVVRVKAWHTSQGDFVEINASDFDSARYELFEPAPLPPPPPEPALLPPPPEPALLPPPPAQVPA